MTSDIKELNSLLLRAQEAYYSGAPIMSDAVYDLEEAKLKALVTKNPQFSHLATVLQKVGTAKAGARVKHAHCMLSIENKYDKQEIVDFFKKVAVAVCLEPKRDGLSCSLTYRKGSLVQALTRGDGESGEIITPQIKALGTIPLFIDNDNFPSEFEVRGELVMRRAELERINADLAKRGEKPYSSPRNLAVGTIKLKDLKEVSKRKVEFSPWALYGKGLPDSHIEKMLLLGNVGFLEYDGFLVLRESEIISTIDEVLSNNKKSEIPSDGVVVKVDSYGVQNQLGVASKYTNYQCCFKPQSSAKPSFLRRVIWQVGRQGKLTPVGECDPIELAGAQISRVTLNNETWITEMGLMLDAEVMVLRSGEIIPQIIEVLDTSQARPIEFPKVCPECNTKLTVYTHDSSAITTRWCPYEACQGRVRDLFSFVGSRDVLEIDGLGPEMAAQLVAKNYAINLAELFEFQLECLQNIAKLGENGFQKAMAQQGFSGAMVLKMVKSMEEAKQAEWDRWFACLGIPMVSRSLGKLISKALSLTSEDIGVLPKKLLENPSLAVEGLGSNKRASLLDWAKQLSNQDMCARLYTAGVRPKSQAVKTSGEQPLKGVTFCITGEFMTDRDTLSKQLESLGAVAKSGVSKHVNLLICGDSPGKTKLLKAKDLNIKQVGKEWIETTLKAGGIAVRQTPKFEYEEA
jgi:DNA ligase (NAD+)